MTFMSSLEEARREFWDAWNGLREVHTQEALEAQSDKMWTARRRLLKVDPEFRAMIKTREDKANAEAEESSRQTQSRHKTIMSEAESEVAASKMRARAVMRMPNEGIEEWVQKNRFKFLTPEESKTKSKLVCPICLDLDRKNTMNGEPACLKCMHKLVPQEKLKNYNREYRRAYVKKRKTKSRC